MQIIGNVDVFNLVQHFDPGLHLRRFGRFCAEAVDVAFELFLFAFDIGCCGFRMAAALFAFMHVWTFALSSWDWSYLILMLQYLVPGLVFAWAFDHSGTLWTSILLHATVNALALWAIVG